MVTGQLVEQNDLFVVVLSKEQVELLGVRAGDELIIESAAAGVQASKPPISEQLTIAREVIAENREALRELAK